MGMGRRTVNEWTTIVRFWAHLHTRIIITIFAEVLRFVSFRFLVSAFFVHRANGIRLHEALALHCAHCRYRRFWSFSIFGSSFCAIFCNFQIEFDLCQFYFTFSFGERATERICFKRIASFWLLGFGLCVWRTKSIEQISRLIRSDYHLQTHTRIRSSLALVVVDMLWQSWKLNEAKYFCSFVNIGFGVLFCRSSLFSPVEGSEDFIISIFQATYCVCVCACLYQEESKEHINNRIESSTELKCCSDWNKKSERESNAQQQQRQPKKETKKTSIESHRCVNKNALTYLYNLRHNRCRAQNCSQSK